MRLEAAHPFAKYANGWGTATCGGADLGLLLGGDSEPGHGWTLAELADDAGGRPAEEGERAGFGHCAVARLLVGERLQHGIQAGDGMLAAAVWEGCWERYVRHGGAEACAGTAARIKLVFDPKTPCPIHRRIDTHHAEHG
jgi:hypothetical protein